MWGLFVVPHIHPFDGWIWGSNGFDIIWIETNASRGCLVGLVKLSRQKLNANTNTVDMAMSVAQADAVLAKYSYSDAVVVTA